MNVLASQKISATYSSSASATVPSTPAPSLMPEPNNALDGDPMAMMYAIISKQRSNDLLSGQANARQNCDVQKAELKQEQDAIQKQEEAEQSAAQWGLFGKIASVIAIAVSAVAAVVTCGAASALCAAACVLSTLAFAEGQAQVLTKLTGNPDVDKAFEVGAGVAAAVCSGGAGLASIGATTLSVVAGVGQTTSAACGAAQQVLGCINDKGCQDAAMGFGIAGSVTAVAGGAAGLGGAASGADAAKIVKATADVAKGATEIGGGVATIVSSQFEADATDRAADAKQAKSNLTQLDQLTQWLIDAIKDTDDSHKRALQTLQGVMQTKGQTLIIASAKV